MNLPSTFLKFVIVCLSASLFFLSGCKKEEIIPCEDGIQNGTETGIDCGGSCSSGCTWTVSPSANDQDAIQEALILMSNNDTLQLTAGTYTLTSTLSIDGKSGVVIRGAGMDETMLDFSGQTNGAQGFLGTDLSWFLMHDFSIIDASGDGVKIKDSDGISMIKIGVEYTGPVSSSNGAYGLYPVTSTHVLVDQCYVRGASDAGIYIGQSEDVIASNNTIEENVAGLEIENCINADVFGNVASNNTGGILAFDLEGLPVIPNGAKCRIYNNTLINNNHKNFAPAGNIVATVPVGTGIMVLSFADVEIFDNTITDNYVMGVGVISMYTAKALDGDNSPLAAGYDPYIYRVNIHDNTFSSARQYPAEPNGSAQFIVNDLFGSPANVSDIIYDGFKAPEYDMDPTEGLCIQNNGNASFGNVQANTLFTNPVDFDVTQHICTQPSLPEVTVDAPRI